MQVMGELGTPIVLLVGSYLTARGMMDLGTLVGVTGYIWMLTNPMRMLSNIINMLTRTVTSGENCSIIWTWGPASARMRMPRRLKRSAGMWCLTMCHSRTGPRRC